MDVDAINAAVEAHLQRSKADLSEIRAVLETADSA